MGCLPRLISTSLSKFSHFDRPPSALSPAIVKMHSAFGFGLDSYPILAP